MEPATALSLSLQPEGSASRIGYLVYRVERLIRARLDDGLRRHGVTTPEFITLSVLRNHDGLTGAELARWGCVTPQAMNLVVSSLERQGLVLRNPDPADRRLLRASVTPAGLRLLKLCDRCIDEIERDMIGDLDGEALRETLTTCMHALDGPRPLPGVQPLRDTSAAQPETAST